ncbi:N-acetyl-gamma-glutamyl-phosphate reductase [Caminibacter pacificus]|uniref:N-acetyl-gamma-glutamyl-phosphate reductase n=1 Tax=Caminibacter pacificus TaxID=1424653 RepID=A0AAJ4RDM0_9BACT|nr:N-acetyl-gamma-glutamyl-phosphate reductase [Caminibacter pacificus]QCI28588.1 N-acetyl-gamma-glutamyl-phosphate reductase [Caminibacter pacificus]ROR40683.1 N-acetyl-gamma-glutamyl-phosphate reductase [Caminibacter pacificus]
MIKTAIVGASGYTGLELIKILLNHPHFEISALFGSEGGERIEDIYPSLKGVFEAEIQKADVEKIAKYDLVFLAVPHKTAMALVKELYGKTKIVDFSADYRLNQKNYEDYYCPHIDPANLENSAYGLPEIFRDYIKKSTLIANPGCYPTATILALYPFIEYIEDGVFVDAKSGVSGAGKKLSATTHFVKDNENFFAYNPIKHRHSVEIKEKTGLNVTFVPQLLPITRGMQISIYAKLKKDIDLLEVLKEKYKNEEFIRIFDKPVEIKNVAGTHYCDIFAAKNENMLFINSVIDNLLRGASSQAVANANLIFGLDEGLALPKIAYVP